MQWSLLTQEDTEFKNKGIFSKSRSNNLTNIEDLIFKNKTELNVQSKMVSVDSSIAEIPQIKNSFINPNSQKQSVIVLNKLGRIKRLIN